jgi:hypothetical protein
MGVCLGEEVFMSVKIKFANSPAEKVSVHIDRPIWREFLQY